MGSHGGYYKGEKKKKKQNKGKDIGNFAPVFVPPEIINKKRKTD